MIPHGRLHCLLVENSLSPGVELNLFLFSHKGLLATFFSSSGLLQRFSRLLDFCNVFVAFRIAATFSLSSQFQRCFCCLLDSATFLFFVFVTYLVATFIG